MATGTFTVADFQAWGNLVKSWAKGTQAWPTTIAELQSQCDAAGAGAQIQGYLTIKLVQTPSETELLLRLPPRKHLEESEARLNTPGASYSIPYFYKRLFGQEEDPVIPQDQKMKVHAERIGDYTMSACQ